MASDENPTPLFTGRQMHQQTLFGDGTLAQMEDILGKMKLGSMLLVADEQAYRLSGAEAVVGPLLSQRRNGIFSDFHENPLLEDVEAGIDRLRDGGHDGILAIGGGSALDVAKLVAACSTQQAPPKAVITGEAKIDRPGLPVIAVPTTAGTGAHVTHFSAVFVDGKKYSLAHDTLRPAVAIVDPVLTFSMPPRITAATGLDALCQAIESMWAVGSTSGSREYAREAIRLAVLHLETAVRRPTPEARRGMCRASHLAGLAIDVSKTTAAHAMAYALTIDYGVPHGMAVALTLAPLLEYNSQVTDEDCIDPRGPEHVHDVINQVVHLFACRTPEEACVRIVDLLRAIDCPARLSEVGVTDAAQRDAIGTSVNAERLGNNPRRFDHHSIAELLGSIA